VEQVRRCQTGEVSRDVVVDKVHRVIAVVGVSDGPVQQLDLVEPPAHHQFGQEREQDVVLVLRGIVRHFLH